LSIIKPDAVERELETKIKKIFLDNKLNIVESKKIQISKEEAEDFYRVHQTKPFYEKLCSYLSSGPIIVMILDGENAIQKNRDLMGATDPQKAKDGTIRKIYGISIDKNSVHGSDSPKNAEVEINFFFN
jgi:nucleoside-diphosphate kinase